MSASKVANLDGVSAVLAAKMRGLAGWSVLDRLYRLPSARLDRDQSLLVLQKQIDGLHVGGKTALAWQGVRHNISQQRCSLCGAMSVMRSPHDESGLSRDLFDIWHLY